jgi:hypothetical protein
MGPHHIISQAELFGTLVILGVALVLITWMAYKTRWHSPH